MKKPIYAIKFKNFCQNNGYLAQDIAEIINVKKATVYKYFSGRTVVPDEAKKKLEKEIGLNLYDVFFNESFDNEYVVVKKNYLEFLEQQVK